MSTKQPSSLVCKYCAATVMFPCYAHWKVLRCPVRAQYNLPILDEWIEQFEQLGRDLNAVKPRRYLDELVDGAVSLHERTDPDVEALNEEIKEMRRAIVTRQERGGK
jgi:hypothetical protein